MTITLTPDQEKAVREAIGAGRVASLEEFVQRAVAELPKPEVEHGIGLFGSPEDSALLDEVVAISYEERRRPGKRES